VVLTVYNGESHIGEAIKSIQQQTFEDWELVIIDDGSTDETLAVVRATNDDRIRVYTQDNKGRCSALNRGLGLARGRYVAIIDDDDIAAPQRLERAVEFLEANPEVDLVAAQYERRYEDEGSVNTDTVYPPETHDELVDELPYRNPFAHSLVTYRRAAVDELYGYRDIHSCIDYDLWVRMAVAGCRFGLVPETLGTIRKHENRSFNFDWMDQLRYLRVAFTVRLQAARHLNVPRYHYLAPFLMVVWAVLPAPIKSRVRRYLP
jgi:glycosyltransferase involved in cell wall biosynthesis